MRALNCVIAGILLSGLAATSAHAAQDACPSAETVRPVSCPADSWEGCEYKITSASSISWIGSDPLEYGKNEKISVKFLSASARTTDQGTQIYCEYGFYKPDGTDTKDGLRLSMDKPAKINLSDKWSSATADSPSSCQSQSSSECTFTSGS